MTIEDINNLDKNISDNMGVLRDISAIVSELEFLNDSFEIHEKSEKQLRLAGQQEMLEAIIDYLNDIV